jgi:hypothetical protein
MSTEDWPEPRVTGNAHLLAGFIAGSIGRPRIGGERLYEVERLENPVIVSHTESGNRYRVTVEQISGSE